MYSGCYAAPWKYACALLQHCRATFSRPAYRRDRRCSKWMPPQRREIPASSAAAEKVGHDNLTGADGVSPGSTLELPGSIVTRGAEPVAAGEEPQDLGARRA